VRGGRVTKWRGKVASIAPALAAVAVAAPVLMEAPAALAACSISGNTATCSGSDSSTQTINFTAASAASVTFDPGYQNTTAGNTAIKITSNGNPTSLTISDDATNPATISGGVFGVYVDYQGSGATSVTLNGNITGTGSNDALRVDNDASGGDITIVTKGTLIGNTNHGIHVERGGTGNITITTDGSVTGNTLQGIIVKAKNGNAGNITVTTNAAVQGKTDGIDIRHSGDGNIVVTTNGTVTGTNANGIQVDHNGTGNGSVTITANGAITAGDNGIEAFFDGIGDVTVNSHATITADGNGLHVNHKGTGNIGISVTDAVTATGHGIYADAGSGDGDITISIDADITSNNKNAINTETRLGKLTTIDIQSGTIDGTSGRAIYNNKGDSNTTVASAAVIKGDIVLGDGTDALTFNGADVSGVTLFDGGDDIATGDGWVDVLTFDGITFTANDGSMFKNWEVFSLENNSHLTVHSGTVGAGVLEIDSGSSFNFGNLGAGNVTLAGDVLNNGLITSQDGTAGDQLTVKGDYDGNGTVSLDTYLDDGAVDTTDKLTVQGDNDGTIVVHVENTNGPGDYTGNGPTDGIQVVDIQGANNGDVVLDAPVVAGAYNYKLTPDGYLQSSPAGGATIRAVMPMLLPTFTESLWERVSSTWAFSPTTPRSENARVAGYNITPTSATPMDMVDGVWLRGRYRYLNADADLDVGGVADDASTKMHRLWVQLGYTHGLSRTASGVLAGSAFVQYKHTRMTLTTGLGGSAKGKADAYGGGASLTWLGSDGIYADLLGEVSRHRITITDRGTNLSARSWATTWRLSMEGGWRIPVAENLNVIPQAQLNVRGSDFDSFTLSGVRYAGDAFTQVNGRIGLGLEIPRMAVSDGMDISVQLTTSLLHDFSKSNSVDVGGTAVTGKFARTFAEVRSNIALISPQDSVSFFLENRFRHSLKGPRQYSLKVSAGVKLSF